jgi:hypothetical protein
VIEPVKADVARIVTRPSFDGAKVSKNRGTRMIAISSLPAVRAGEKSIPAGCIDDKPGLPRPFIAILVGCHDFVRSIGHSPNLLHPGPFKRMYTDVPTTIEQYLIEFGAAHFECLRRAIA